MADPDPTRSRPAGPAGPEPTAAYQLSDAGEELVRVLDQYLSDLEAGRAPSREKLLAEHSGLARQLEPCLSGIEFIHRAARPSPESPAQLGDFRIVREVGRGGMGVVYEAEQLSLKRKVALKVLRFGAVADKDAMERFQREAETVAQLHHTNIVPIFAIGSQQGVSYYAMQFIEGRSLAAVLEESQKAVATGRGDRPHLPERPGAGHHADMGGAPTGTLPFAGLLDPTEIGRWGLQAADALAHAHQRGVIHRDVKPSNLILDPDGRIWLTDFGLAKRMDDMALSMTGALLGTPRYMSPEQASATRLPIDQRTDIYSLGVTLYELATGRPLFDSDTPHGIIAQILTAEPQPPRRLRADLPRDLETIILKCIAKEAAGRYATAQDLADDLRAFTQGWPIKARRARLAEKAVRWVRRQRRSVTVAAAAAAISVLLVVGGTASWWSYRQSRLGYVSLTTSGPSLAAEILPEDGDDPVVPSMAVPSQEPVALPEGRYRLRLSASGLLSETWPLDVQRGSRPSLDVRLHGQWLWPPMNVFNEDRPAELIDLAGRSDVVIVQNVARDGAAGLSVRRLDGATGKPVWPADLEFDEKTAPQGGDAAEWRLAIGRSENMGPPRLLQPASDLDGDGTRDLVWACRNSPSLLAVSGKAGKPLWWFRGRPAPKEKVDLATWRPIYDGSCHGSTVGQPAVADIDGDGTDDLIACFISAGETFAHQNQYVQTGPQAWVEAVSGRTGKSLWRHALSHAQTARLAQTVTGLLAGSSASRTDELACQPEIVRVKGRRVVVMVLDKMLWGVDLNTGKDAWTARDVGLDLLRPPQLGNLDGDGRPAALLTGRQNQDHFLTLVSLDTGQELWRCSYQPFASYSMPESTAPEWPVVADLDGDGRAEVIIPILNDGAERWTGVEVLNAASGEVRWQRRLLRSGAYQPIPVRRMIAGPDLDGDGCREVFVAFGGQDHGGRSCLSVAAFSGANGRTLWRWKRKVPHASPTDEPSPLQWWHAGVDGWPQLVVPVDNGPGSQPMTFILSAGSGRLACGLPEVADPRLADFNGDHIADIFYRQAFATGSDSYEKLVVLRGEMPEPWRQLGCWTPAQDFDGDGVVDLLSADGTARSGEDGRVLWRIGMQSPVGEPFLSPPLPPGDLDGDGTPDVLGLEHVQRRVAPNAFTFGPAVSAFSGNDGRRLWTADIGMSNGILSGSGPNGEYRYPCLGWCDLDQDSRAEVLVAYPAAGNAGFRLAVLSGRDGKLLWSTLLVAGGFPLGDARHRPQLADLDGDGTLDLVLCAPNSADASRRTDALLALSGRDGRLLWPPSSAIVQKDEYGPMRAAAGDLDGDGTPEVVLIRTDQDAQGRQLGHLMALDGRDARTKWTWSWTKESHVSLPPLLVDLDGNGHRAVCVCIQEKGVWQIVVLGPEGRVRERIPLKIPDGRSPELRRAVPWWAPADLDGDGREELLFISNNQIWASRGSTTSAPWTRSMPAEDLAILDIHPSSKDRPAIVAVQAGRSVYGLSGLTGRTLWRCEVDPGPASVLWAGDSEAPPRLWTTATSRAWSTACRQAWPTRPDGQYAQLAPAPMTYELQQPEEVRPLPWWGDQTGVLAVPAIGGLCLVLVVIPGLLVRRGARQGSWALGLLAVLYGMFGILLCSGVRDTDLLLGVSLLVALAVPVQLAYWAFRRKSLQLHLLVLTGVAAALGAFLYGYRPSQFGRGPLVQFGQAWLVAILMAAAAVPFVALAGLVIAYVRRRQWARIGWLMGLSLFLSLAIAALLLALDARQKEASESYDWSGWYMVWPLGAYAAGALAVLGLAIRICWRRLRAMWRERSAKQLLLMLAALLLLLLVVIVILIVVLSPFAVMQV